MGDAKFVFPARTFAKRTSFGRCPETIELSDLPDGFDSDRPWGFRRRCVSLDAGSVVPGQVFVANRDGPLTKRFVRRSMRRSARHVRCNRHGPISKEAWMQGGIEFSGHNRIVARSNRATGDVRIDAGQLTRSPACSKTISCPARRSGPGLLDRFRWQKKNDRDAVEAMRRRPFPTWAVFTTASHRVCGWKPAPPVSMACSATGKKSVL